MQQSLNAGLYSMGISNPLLIFAPQRRRGCLGSAEPGRSGPIRSALLIPWRTPMTESSLESLNHLNHPSYFAELRAANPPTHPNCDLPRVTASESLQLSDSCGWQVICLMQSDSEIFEISTYLLWCNIYTAVALWETLESLDSHLLYACIWGRKLPNCLNGQNKPPPGRFFVVSRISGSC